MKTDKTTIIKQYILGLLLILLASALRIWPLQALDSKLAWLTYYPAVMIASIYGGLYVGIASTVTACFVVQFFWKFIVAEPFLQSAADYGGLAVFIITGTMISAVSESMRRASTRANIAQKKAEAASNAKSIFLANMSHELRTPLNAVLGYSQLLLRNESLPKEAIEYITIINRSGEHLLSLINQILETSKIEAGHAVLQVTNFNFHAMLEDVEKMFREKTDSKHLAFEILGIDKIPKYIYSDETKLKIIFINLIGNAVKFTDIGHIILRLSTQNTTDGLRLYAEVEDTGSGIDDKETDRLFKYFSQTESGRKTNEGTGLGLAISKEYINLMGGDIFIDRCYIEGCLFKFNVKVEIGKEFYTANTVNQKVKKIKPNQKVPKVLVVEDEPVNRSLLVTLLKEAGFEVSEAENGKEAVEVFDKILPDFIWMDIRMPVMSGTDATLEIKAKHAGKTVKIVALSAHALEKEKEIIMASGCDGFLSKPFHENEIFETMAKHLGIEYDYAEVSDGEITENSNQELELFSLNDSFLEELSEAVSNTDAYHIIRLAEELKEKEPVIAELLMNCANNYDYLPIKKAINQVNIRREGQLS